MISQEHHQNVCIVLTLAEKIKVIEAVDNGLSNVKVASMFGSGHTQVGNIILNKSAILEECTNGTKTNTKYLQPHHCVYSQIDAKVWEFYCETRSKNMPVNGGLLKAEALAMANQLKINNFIASNGWMDTFSARHQLKFSTLHGESAEVDTAVCDQWKE